MKVSMWSGLAATLLMLPSNAMAQTMKDTVELAPGGQTIGGPGAQVLAVADDVFILGGNFPDVCITVANVGDRGKIQIRSVETNATIHVRMTVEPNETGTRCYSSEVVSAISLGCSDFDPMGRRIQPVDPQPCRLLWRADQVSG